MKDLMKQRRLWHLGLSQGMTSYPILSADFANPRFGLSELGEVFGILTVGFGRLLCF